MLLETLDQMFTYDGYRYVNEPNDSVFFYKNGHLARQGTTNRHSSTILAGETIIYIYIQDLLGSTYLLNLLVPTYLL